MKYPHPEEKIEKIVILGGAVNVKGNIQALDPKSDNTVAEWNIYADPKAAEIVFSSKIPVTLVSLDATNQVPITKEFYESLSQQLQPGLKLIYQLLKVIVDNFGMELFLKEFYLWDPLAAMICFDPKIAITENMSILMDLETAQTKLVDKGSNGSSIVSVVIKIPDAQLILGRLIDEIKSNIINKMLPTEKEISHQLLDGDLMFGSSTAITNLFKKFSLNNLVENNYAMNHFTVDIYNNALRSFSIYPLRKLISMTTLALLYSSDEVKNAYQLDTFSARFEDELRSNPDYYQVTPEKLFNKMFYGTLDPFTKKRCKLGLLWTLSKNDKIHFILDGINFDDCFNKRVSRYTYSELRFVFRNWNNLKGFYADNKLNFYRITDEKLKKVEAPWEIQPEITKNYKPKNSHGHLYISFFEELRLKNSSLKNSTLDNVDIIQANSPYEIFSQYK